MKISKKILFITFFIICILNNMVLAKTGKVNIEATRIRQEANTSSNIITVIYEDDEVEILEESGEWYKVKYKNDTGYVKKEFITEDKGYSNTNKVTNNTNTSNTTSNTVSNTVSNTTIETPSASDETSVTEAPVDESTLTINSETYVKVLPNFSSNNIIKFEATKQVEKLAEINNWIQVTDGDYTGWILKIKVQTDAVVEEPTVEPEVSENENTNNIVDNNTSTSNTISNTVSNTATDSVTNTTPSTSNSTLNKKAVVTVETAIVRDKATTSSNAIGFLDYGDEITLLEQEGDWYKISFEDQTGYVKNTLIKISDDSVSSRSMSEERLENTTYQSKEKEETTSSNGVEVVNYAKQYLGCAYVAGGKTPTTGFDCSGYTRYVYLNFGYSLSSTSSSQANMGTEVSRDNLIPGDLILFLDQNKNGIGHTGIYIGGGEFIHAANPQRGVVIDNLNTNSYYNERFVTARRIVD